MRITEERLKELLSEGKLTEAMVTKYNEFIAPVTSSIMLDGTVIPGLDLSAMAEEAVIDALHLITDACVPIGHIEAALFAARLAHQVFYLLSENYPFSLEEFKALAEAIDIETVDELEDDIPTEDRKAIDDRIEKLLTPKALP